MRSPSASDGQLAEVTRRRLKLLSAEIAEARGERASRTAPEKLEPGGLALEWLAPADAEPSETSATAGAADRPGRHARRSVDARARAAGWVHDRLPPILQGRVSLGPSQVAVIALTLATGLTLSAWWVVRSDDAGDAVPPAVSSGVAQGDMPELTAVPVGLPRATTAPAGEVPGGSSAIAGTSPMPLSMPLSGPSTAAYVVVDIIGRVRRPGIATLPVGARVVDAIAAAGGLRRGVDPIVNLARVLVDGEQIVVGIPASAVGPAASAVGAATGSPAGAALVSLNSADQATLETLPGVGPVTAQAILTWREENGAFHAVEELLEVSGIGSATLAEIAPHVTL